MAGMEGGWRKECSASEASPPLEGHTCSARRRTRHFPSLLPSSFLPLTRGGRKQGGGIVPKGPLRRDPSALRLVRVSLLPSFLLPTDVAGGGGRNALSAAADADVAGWRRRKDGRRRPAGRWREEGGRDARRGDRRRRADVTGGGGRMERSSCRGQRGGRRCADMAGGRRRKAEGRQQQLVGHRGRRPSRDVSGKLGVPATRQPGATSRR